MNKKIKYLYIILMSIININSVNADTLGITTNIDSINQNTSLNIIIISSIILILVILLSILITKILLSRKNLNQTPNNTYIEPNLKKIDSNLNKESLKEQVFSLYKNLETAKTKQKITTLKEVLTNDLYLELEKTMNHLKEKQYKIVATNIKLKDFKVLSIIKNKDSYNIVTYLYVSQYDYVIDKKKKVVRGTSEDEYQIEYKITLEKSTDNHLKIKKKECTGKWIKN